MGKPEGYVSPSRGGRGRNASPVTGVSVVSGNGLTATERRTVVTMLNQGANDARSGRTNYSIRPNGKDSYIVKVQRRDRGLGFVGDQLRTSTYTTTISVKR